MQYAKLGEKLDKKAFRKSIADYIGNTQVGIRIGRSANYAGFSNNTPIEIVDGDDPPKLVGRPFLSTNFRRGSFSKNMYTASTLHVVVGREWKAK